MKHLHKFTCLLLSLVLLLGACAPVQTSPGNQSEPQAMDSSKAESLADTAKELAGHLQNGQEADAHALMTKQMISATTGKTAGFWTDMEKSGGSFTGFGAYEALVSDGYDIIELTLNFEKSSFIMRAVFDSTGQLAGLFFRAGKIDGPAANDSSGGDDSLPTGITEEDVVVDAGSGFPLQGKLTLPEGEVKAAVVLVHGSGPSNMDETIGANYPFKEIAHGLAAQGIAVLRYDKRTYAHGASMDTATITIDDETTLDAAAAVRLLKEHPAVNPDKIFILGHSMGAGLAAYIATLDGAKAAGYIALAGTTRSLWELMAEQNLAAADELETAGNKEQAEQVRTLVALEVEKAGQLNTLSEEALLLPENNIFGIPALYFKSFEKTLPLPLHMADAKPVLVIHGGKDQQVTELDYTLWQTGLANHPDATFKLYANLNHLMGEYQGEAVSLAELVSKEYAQRLPFSQAVLDDMAAWLLEKAG